MLLFMILFFMIFFMSMIFFIFWVIFVFISCCCSCRVVCWWGIIFILKIILILLLIVICMLLWLVRVCIIILLLMLLGLLLWLLGVLLLLLMMLCLLLVMLLRLLCICCCWVFSLYCWWLRMYVKFLNCLWLLGVRVFVGSRLIGVVVVRVLGLRSWSSFLLGSVGCDICCCGVRGGYILGYWCWMIGWWGYVVCLIIIFECFVKVGEGGCVCIWCCWCVGIGLVVYVVIRWIGFWSICVGSVWVLVVVVVLCWGWCWIWLSCLLWGLSSRVIWGICYWLCWLRLVWGIVYRGLRLVVLLIFGWRKLCCWLVGRSVCSLSRLCGCRIVGIGLSRWLLLL